MVSLLEAYLARFQVAPQFDADDVAHYLLPIPGVVHSYVVEADGAPVLPAKSSALRPAGSASQPDTTRVGVGYVQAGGQCENMLTRFSAF